MRSSFLALLFFSLISIVSLQSALSLSDFHFLSHCATEPDHSEEGNDGAPEHLHAGTCFHSFCVSVAETVVSSLEKTEEIFSENPFTIKPDPYLEGPLQPPRKV